MTDVGSGDRPQPGSENVEGIVLQAWTSKLGPKGRGANRTLVETGVGVIRILNMIDEIESRLGVRIPVGTALRLGTPDAIASAIRADRWPSPSPSLLLRDGPRGRPLFLIAGGAGLCVEMLGLNAGIDHPGQTWALQPPGFEGDAPSIRTTEALAEHYADNLPVGRDERVNFVGFSFGGLVGLETARILRSRGYEIGLVGLVDSTLAERQWPWSVRLPFLLKRTRSRLFGLANVPSGRRLQAVWNIVRPFAKRVVGLVSVHPSLSSYYDPKMDARIKTNKDLAIIAYESYAPRPVDFPVSLFVSRQAETSYIDPVDMWRATIPRLEVVRVDGTHGTMLLPPFVTDLAAAVRARLPADRTIPAEPVPA